jgi:hypothetical protein
VYDVAMPLVALYALRALLAVVLAGAGCGTTAQPPAPSTSDATPPVSAAAPAAPAWQTGDRWVFEWTSGKESGTKTAEVADTREINGVPYYVVRLAESEHYYTQALHWAAAAREGKVEARMVPPHPWFVWPLVTGARWTHQGRFEQREAVVTHTDRFTVIGPETIEVPAGRYDTVKVVRETDRRDRDEYWYTPTVRWYARWVGQRGDMQFEERLREYHPAPRPR